MWVWLTCKAPGRNTGTAPPAVISDLLAVDLQECTGFKIQEGICGFGQLVGHQTGTPALHSLQ